MGILHTTGCPRLFKSYSCLKSPKMSYIQGVHIKMPFFWKNVPHLFLRYPLFSSLLFLLTHFLFKRNKNRGFCRNICYFLKRSSLFYLHLKRSFLFTQAFSRERTFFFFSINYDLIET